jgi:hypothetical protein
METVFVNGCSGNSAGSFPGLFWIHSGGGIFANLMLSLSAGECSSKCFL